MIIDVHCHLGHWPFRPLRHNTAAGLVERMDRFGIDRAVVASANAIFYRDAQAGNEELAQNAAAFGERFILLATVNPKYAGWERDLDRCRARAVDPVWAREQKHDRENENEAHGSSQCANPGAPHGTLPRTLCSPLRPSGRST